MKKRAFSFLSMQNIPLKHKLFWCVLVSALLIGLVSLLGFQISMGVFNDVLYEQTEASLALFSEQIKADLVNATEMSRSLASNSLVQETLTELLNPPTTIDRSLAIKKLYQVLYRLDSSNIVSATILPEYDNSLVWGRSSLQEPKIVLEEVRRQCLAEEGGIVWYPSSYADGTILCAQTILGIEDFSLQQLGYVILRIDLGHVVEKVLSKYHYNRESTHVSIY